MTVFRFEGGETAQQWLLRGEASPPTRVRTFSR
jgi:hypothetical protein